MSDERPDDDEIDAVMAYRAWQEAKRMRQPWADSLKADYLRLRGDDD